MKIINKAFFALASLALALASTPEAKTPDESGDGDLDAFMKSFLMTNK